MTAAEGFGVYALAATIMAIGAPLVGGAARLRWTLATVAVIAAGAAGVHVLSVDMAPTEPGPGAGGLACATATLVGFGAFLGGLARCARRWASAAVIAAGLGLLAIATPFATDALLEDRDGAVRPAVRDATLWVNPVAAMAAPDQLGIDWLRRSAIYESVRLGAFHRYRYPPGWIWLAWLGLGAISCAGAVVTSRNAVSCSAAPDENVLVRSGGLL